MLRIGIFYYWKNFRFKKRGPKKKLFNFIGIYVFWLWWEYYEKGPSTYYVILKSNILPHTFSLLVIFSSTHLPQTLPPDHDALYLRVPQNLECLFQLGICSGQPSCTAVFLFQIAVCLRYLLQIFNHFHDTSNLTILYPRHILSYVAYKPLPTPKKLVWVALN